MYFTVTNEESSLVSLIAKKSIGPLTGKTQVKLDILEKTSNI
jgi:hypothetical protein